MKRLRRGWHRLLGALGMGRSDADLAEELATHLEMQVEDNLRRGMAPEEARRAARLEFGGVEQAKERWRDQRGFPFLDGLRQDARIALRMLWRAPSVSIPAILVLILGVGSATALYAIVYAMWLRPLPYPDAGRLLSVSTYFAAYKLDTLLSADYGTWQNTRSLGPLAAWSVASAALAGPEETVEAGRARVSGNLMQVLRVEAALGRGIQPADDSPEAPPVAVLTDGLWRRAFGADPNVVGRAVRIDGELHLVAGVLPRGFRMPDERPVDLLTPLALRESYLRHGTGGTMRLLRGAARLQPGAALEQARAELAARLAASRDAEPQIYGGDVALRVLPLRDTVVRDTRAAGIALAGVVGVILLIAAANVAGLLVARAAGRGREMAIRAALGAGAARIARQLLMEGLALAAFGIAGGLALARALVSLAPRVAAAGLWVDDAALNGPVLGAVLAAVLLCSLGFSLAPALPLPRRRVRRALVVGELALSLVLLVAAALLLENLARLRAVAPGFRTAQLVTASLSLKGSRFAETPAALRRELQERLARTPGVVCAAFADALPPSDASRVTTFSRADRPRPKAFHRGDKVVVRLVDASFFEAMGIPLRQGRVFTEADQAGEGLVAVVNRSLADRHFAGEDPLGKQVDGQGLPWKTVVGVVADTRNDGLLQPTRPEIYLPLTGHKPLGGGVTQDHGLTVAIRTAGDPAATMAALRAEVRQIDPGLLAKVRTMDERWAELQAGPRFQAVVFGGFAGLAVLMACAGVYGVLSHTVELRRREIGIRVALGARPVDVQAMVVREALGLAAAGAAIGVGGAVAVSRVLGSLLTGVDPRDPATLGAMAALLVALAACAGAVPARRAARDDPAATLRAE